MPVTRVFALELRERADTLVARILGFHDDDGLPERHVPPLPATVETNSAPYRRLMPGA